LRAKAELMAPLAQGESTLRIGSKYDPAEVVLYFRAVGVVRC